MKVFALNKEGKLTKDNLRQVVEIFRKGGVVVVPTDTSYGLSAAIGNQKAFGKVFRVKKRSKVKVLPIVVSGRSQALKYGRISCKPTKLWRAFLPGPLTLVVQSKVKNKPYVRKDNNTVAIRFVSTPVILQLLRKINKPLSITSANISGKGDIYSLTDFKEQYKNNNLPDAFINAGRLKKTKPSTSVRFNPDKSMDIVRVGPISKKQIFNALK